MGSGHILVYAFDVFVDLYKAEGYSEREAAELIMTQNLFGLEIDKRAYQLAYFAIMMKGRQYSRRIFSKNVKLNLHHFVSSGNIPDEYFERLEELSDLSNPDFASKLADFKAKIAIFKHADEIGSVLNLTDIKSEDIEKLRQFIDVFDEFTNMDILYALPETHKRINDVLDVMEIMATKYEAIVTNPPYLNKMSATLDKYVKDNYPDVKTDLFSVFIKMNSNLLAKGGYAGFMTPFVWMFIKSYEELRNFLITNKSISSLIQMEYSAFEEATVPVCCFTIKNARTEKVGNYFKLSDFRGGMKVQEEKVLEAIQDPSLDYFYQTDQTNFQKIPGSPISFWVSENVVTAFEHGRLLSSDSTTRKGMATGLNDKFVRNWNEVKYDKIGFNVNRDEIPQSKYKWYPYANGGKYRLWYGNLEEVVNWENDGYQLKTERTDDGARARAVNLNLEYIFKEGAFWTSITSGTFSIKYLPMGSLFSSASNALFGEKIFYEMGLLNSQVFRYINKLTNPTLNVNPGDVGKMPLIPVTTEKSRAVELIVKKNIKISKIEWDSYETSWDFEKHPLI